jgi:hypothetical protein
VTTEDDDASCADAIASLLERDVTERRLLARQRAERYGWPAAVRGFLDAHGLDPGPGLPRVGLSGPGLPGTAAARAGARSRGGSPP